MVALFLTASELVIYAALALGLADRESAARGLFFDRWCTGQVAHGGLAMREAGKSSAKGQKRGGRG